MTSEIDLLAIGLSHLRSELTTLRQQVSEIKSCTCGTGYTYLNDWEYDPVSITANSNETNIDEVESLKYNQQYASIYHKPLNTDETYEKQVILAENQILVAVDIPGDSSTKKYIGSYENIFAHGYTINHDTHIKINTEENNLYIELDSLTSPNQWETFYKDFIHTDSINVYSENATNKWYYFDPEIYIIYDGDTKKIYINGSSNHIQLSSDGLNTGNTYYIKNDFTIISTP